MSTDGSVPVHTDAIVAPHVDVGAAHTDIAAAHTDGSFLGVHGDVIVTPHADAIVTPHSDTAPIHADFIVNIHSDDNNDAAGASPAGDGPTHNDLNQGG